MKKTRKTISQKWNIFRLFFIRGRHCSRLHLRQRKIFQGPSWNMGHRVPPAISRYMYKYIYIYAYIFFSRVHTTWKKWKKERKRDFTREIYDLSRGLFKTKFIRNETKDTIARVYSSFFFFFFDVTTGEHSTWQMFSLHVKHIRIWI